MFEESIINGEQNLLSKEENVSSTKTQTKSKKAHITVSVVLFITKLISLHKICENAGQ